MGTVLGRLLRAASLDSFFDASPNGPTDRFGVGGLEPGPPLRICNARRVQACPAHQHVRPAVAHLELEQLLHLVRGKAVGASRWQLRAGIRVAAKAVNASEVGAQALGFELGGDAPRRRVRRARACLAQCARGPGRGPSTAG